MRARWSKRSAMLVVITTLTLMTAGISGSNAAGAAPPTTVLTSTPQGNVTSGLQIADPGSLGSFRGDTAGDAAAVKKIRVIVRNPLGNERQFDSSNAYSGWRFSKMLPSMSTSWSWVAPANSNIDYTLWYEAFGETPDLYWSIPGGYTVSFLGVDTAGNEERPSASNTTVVQVI